MEQGYVPKKLYNFLGFPKDEVNGKVYERQQEIEAEWMQHTKELAHPCQQTLRREKEQAVQFEFDEKMKKERETLDKYLNDDKEAEEKLLLLID
eukprot:4626456-Ditylum_brightwellii.AAC.1